VVPVAEISNVEGLYITMTNSLFSLLRRCSCQTTNLLKRWSCSWETWLFVHGKV